jgi:hypothetical protein
MFNPNMIDGYSRSGLPIMRFIDLVEPVSVGSDHVVRLQDEEVASEVEPRKRGRRPTQP